MSIEQKFIAFNGRKFKTEEECVKYETFNKLKDIIPTLKTVREICNKYNHCHECVFCNDSSGDCILRENIPEYWNLERIGS